MDGRRIGAQIADITEGEALERSRLSLSPHERGRMYRHSEAIIEHSQCDRAAGHLERSHVGVRQRARNRNPSLVQDAPRVAARHAAMLARARSIRTSAPYCLEGNAGVFKNNAIA